MDGAFQFSVPPGYRLENPMLQIRPARPGDAQAAYDIRRHAIEAQCGTCYTAEEVQAWAGVPLTDWFRELVESRFHLLCNGAQVVGTGMLDLQTGEVGAIFVLPERMQQGVGRRMLDHLECLALQAGLQEVNLEATLNAVEFYRRCGYVGETPASYRSGSGLLLACLPMRKALGQR
jgi:GNAT superfamily N-acetyltransferase